MPGGRRVLELVIDDVDESISGNRPIVGLYELTDFVLGLLGIEGIDEHILVEYEATIVEDLLEVDHDELVDVVDAHMFRLPEDSCLVGRVEGRREYPS